MRGDITELRQQTAEMEARLLKAINQRFSALDDGRGVCGHGDGGGNYEIVSIRARRGMNQWKQILLRRKELA
jgi:hypothetical protein